MDRVLEKRDHLIQPEAIFAQIGVKLDLVRMRDLLEGGRSFELTKLT